MFILHIIYHILCTIILERSSMFYHCSSDSTVCTACLPSLNIDRCKSTRFPVVGQNLILWWGFCPLNMGELFVFVATCYLFILNWTHVLGGYAILTIHVMMNSNYDWHIWQPCLTKPIWFVLGKVQLAVVPEALHDCHWYFSKGWRFGRACLGEIPFRLFFFLVKLMTSPCHLKRQVEHNASCRFIHGVTM